MLERLHDQPELLTLAALVRISGLHENTVREHVNGLVKAGLVRRHRAEPEGRGRPAWLYESVDEPGGSEYAGLARALSATLARTAPDPTAAALEAGEAWGHDLAQQRTASGTNPVVGAHEARQEVVGLLDDLGFDPVVDGADPSRVRLTRCPLLEAAHRQSEVVCGVHLGIVRGVLGEYGAEADGTTLQPFAEPGACLLVVPPV